MSETLLVITGLLTPYSARGLTQTLEPIAGSAVMRRTVNGALVDLSVAQMRKYRSTISCSDQNAPALGSVWPGALLTVDCVVELAYLTATGAAERPVVAGSSRVEGDWTFYRPQLSMRVVRHTVNRDEWNAEVGWSLELEEA